MSNCSVSKNTQRNGIEIKFTAKPTPSVLSQLKERGWKWHWKNKLWYTAYSEKSLKFAEELCDSGIAKMIDTDEPVEKESNAPVTKLRFAQHLAAWEAAKRTSWDDKKKVVIEVFLGEDEAVYIKRSGYALDGHYQSVDGVDWDKPFTNWIKIGKGGKTESYYPDSIEGTNFYNFGNGIFGAPLKKHPGWFKLVNEDGYHKFMVNGKVTRANAKKLKELGFPVESSDRSFWVRFQDKTPKVAKKVGLPEMTPIEIPSKISVPKNKRKPHYKLNDYKEYKDRQKLNSNTLKTEILLGKMEMATYKYFDGMQDMYEYVGEDKLVWRIPKDFADVKIYSRDSPFHTGENRIRWDNHYFRYHGRPARAVVDLDKDGEERLNKGKSETPKVVDGSKIAAKFFKTAESLQKKADKKNEELKSALTNTPKRLREWKSKNIDREYLQLKSTYYQAIGQAWENDSLPEVLREISPVASKDDLSPFMRRTGSTGYYDVHLTDNLYFEKMSDQSKAEKYRKQYEAIQTLLGSEFADQQAAKKEAENLTKLINEFKFSKEKGFFPTPPSLSSTMIDYADIENGMTILEPSAGIGHLADAIKERYPDVTIDVAEWFSKGQEILKLKGYNVIGNDALSITGKYDRILMNPPYEKLQDIEHVRYAFENNLKPGGRLVALMGESPFFNTQKKAQAWRDWYTDFVEHEESLEGGFSGKDAFRKTNVRARMVVLNKPVVVGTVDKSIPIKESSTLEIKDFGHNIWGTPVLNRKDWYMPVTEDGFPVNLFDENKFNETLDLFNRAGLKTDSHKSSFQAYIYFQETPKSQKLKGELLEKSPIKVIEENSQKIDEVERLRKEVEELKANEEEYTNYDAKLDAKRDRYLERSNKAEKRADQHWDTSQQISERFAYGQPILVGHHSEGKARRDQQRMWNQTTKSIDERNKAGHYAAKASSVGTGGINSDDPKAIRKLKEQLANRIELQEAMKNMNAAFKAFKKKPESLAKNKKLSEKQKEAVRNFDDTDSYSWEKGRMYPKYRLTNNNANINRIKKRIAELENRLEDETTETEYPEIGLKVICNVEENRIQFEFDDKPEEEIRTFLKREMGLRWSSYHGVWQRKRYGKCDEHEFMVNKVVTFLRDYFDIEDINDDTGIEAVLEEKIEINDSKVDVSVNPILGKKIKLRLPNKEERNAQFAIYEASQLRASHNEKTFANTVGYPLNRHGHNINDRNYTSDPNAQALVETYARELEPTLLITNSKTPTGTPIINKEGIVVSGNNRTMSTKLAITDYPEKYEDYKRELREEWDVFGFEQDASIIDWYDSPVLVRIDYDVPKLTTQELAKYNQSETKGKRPVDKAVELSNILMENEGCSIRIPSILSNYERMSDFYANRSDQKKMMDMLINCNLLTEQEIATYYDANSGFTNTGKNFLEATLSASILDKDSIMAADKAGVKELRRSIITTLPTLMQNKGLKEGALTSCINDAVMYQLELKMSGMSFSDFIRQTSIFERKTYSPKCILINRLMNAGRNKFKKAIAGYNETLLKSAGANMFGDAPTPEEAFKHHIESVIPKRELEIISQFSKLDNQPKKVVEPITETEKDYDFRTLSDDDTNELLGLLEKANVEVDIDVEGIEMDRMPNDAMFMEYKGHFFSLQVLGTDFWVEVIPNKSKPDDLEKLGLIQNVGGLTNKVISAKILELLNQYTEKISEKKSRLAKKIEAFKIAFKYAKGDKKSRLERKIAAFEIALKHSK